MATKLNGRPFREAALLGNQPEWPGDTRPFREAVSFGNRGGGEGTPVGRSPERLFP